MATTNDYQISNFLIDMISQSKNNSEKILDDISGYFAIISMEGEIFRGNSALAKVLNVRLDRLIYHNISELFTEKNWNLFKKNISILLEEEDDSSQNDDEEILFELSINKSTSQNELKQTYLWSVATFSYPYSDKKRLFTISARYIGELLMVQEELKKINEDLELRVRYRTKELEMAHTRMVKLAHNAGMAEVASNILHTLGNTVNSVSVGLDNINKTINRSVTKRLGKRTKLFEDNKDDLASFVQTDKGKSLISFVCEFPSYAEEEHSEMLEQCKTMKDNVQKLKVLMETQEKYAGVDKFIEKLDLTAVIGDALTIMGDTLESRNITLENEHEEKVVALGQRNKLINATLLVLKNAQEALEGREDKKIFVKLVKDLSKGKCILSIEDNGPGIPDEDIINIFKQGYTTKDHHDGLGLHTTFNLLKEMEGQLIINSKGPEKGTKVQFILPLQL